LATCADLEDLFAHHRLLDATIEEIDAAGSGSASTG
jgi:hypothetical protein